MNSARVCSSCDSRNISVRRERDWLTRRTTLQAFMDQVTCIGLGCGDSWCGFTENGSFGIFAESPFEAGKPWYWRMNKTLRDRHRSKRLMIALDQINDRWGAGTLRYAATGLHRIWSTQFHRRSHAYTTNWDELPPVHATA